MSTPNFEIGSPDKDLYLKAGGVPYLKLSTAGVLSPINSGSISGTTVTNASLVAAGIGSWTDVTYASGNFTGLGAMTWTVDSGDAQNYSYCRIGNVLHVSLWLITTSVGGTPNVALQVAVPGGLQASVAGTNNGGSYQYSDAGTIATGLWMCNATTPIQFLKANPSANWGASTNTTEIKAQITLRLS